MGFSNILTAETVQSRVAAATVTVSTTTTPRRRRGRTSGFVLSRRIAGTGGRAPSLESRRNWSGDRCTTTTIIICLFFFSPYPSRPVYNNIILQVYIPRTHGRPPARPPFAGHWRRARPSPSLVCAATSCGRAAPYGVPRSSGCLPRTETGLFRLPRTGRPSVWAHGRLYCCRVLRFAPVCRAVLSVPVNYIYFFFFLLRIARACENFFENIVFFILTLYNPRLCFPP